MKISYRLILLVAICLYADLSTYGQQWQYSLKKHGWHTAQVSINGKTPDGIVQTTLSIQHDCIPNEIFTLNYLIPGADDMKNFNFEDFDGPNPPVYLRKLKLMTIKLRFKSGYELLKIAIAGWLEFEPEDERKTTFRFHKAEVKGLEYKKGSDIFRLVKALQKNPLSISVSVQSYSDRSKVIHTEFPVVGLSTALTKILQGCDKPVKRH